MKLLAQIVLRNRRISALALSPFNNTGVESVTENRASSVSGIIERFGVLQAQEVILGLFGEYVQPTERAWSGGLVQILVDLGFSNAAARVALNRVVARRLLAPEKQGRFVFYTITPGLQVVHNEGRHQTFSSETEPQWTNQWTIVCYAASDDKRVQRARLGRWISLRGFGQMQEGVWIAPGIHDADVNNLAQRLGLNEQVVIFVGELGQSYDLSETIARAWRVSELSTLYDVFLKEFGPHGEQTEKLQAQPREAFIVRTRLIEMFRYMTMHDPRVPDKFVGLEWRRGDAIGLFQELQQALRPAACQYFHSRAITGDLSGD